MGFLDGEIVIMGFYNMVIKIFKNGDKVMVELIKEKEDLEE